MPVVLVTINLREAWFSHRLTTDLWQAEDAAALDVVFLATNDCSGGGPLIKWVAMTPLALATINFKGARSRYGPMLTCADLWLAMDAPVLEVRGSTVSQPLTISPCPDHRPNRDRPRVGYCLKDRKCPGLLYTIPCNAFIFYLD